MRNPDDRHSAQATPYCEGTGRPPCVQVSPHTTLGSSPSKMDLFQERPRTPMTKRVWTSSKLAAVVVLTPGGKTHVRIPFLPRFDWIAGHLVRVPRSGAVDMSPHKVQMRCVRAFLLHKVAPDCLAQANPHLKQLGSQLKRRAFLKLSPHSTSESELSLAGVGGDAMAGRLEFDDDGYTLAWFNTRTGQHFVLNRLLDVTLFCVEGEASFYGETREKDEMMSLLMQTSKGSLVKLGYFPLLELDECHGHLAGRLVTPTGGVPGTGLHAHPPSHSRTGGKPAEEWLLKETGLKEISLKPVHSQEPGDLRRVFTQATSVGQIVYFQDEIFAAYLVVKDPLIPNTWLLSCRCF